MGIKIKLNRIPTLGAPQFSRAEMREIGAAVRDAEVDRIGQGLKPDLTSAANLTARYARRKAKFTGGKAIRNWVFTGEMMKSLAVTVSSNSRALIKFPAATVKKASIREAKDELFSMSKRGEDAGGEAARKYFEKAVKRAIS